MIRHGDPPGAILPWAYSTLSTIVDGGMDVFVAHPNVAVVAMFYYGSLVGNAHIQGSSILNHFIPSTFRSAYFNVIWCEDNLELLESPILCHDKKPMALNHEGSTFTFRKCQLGELKERVGKESTHDGQRKIFEFKQD